MADLLARKSRALAIAAFALGVLAGWLPVVATCDASTATGAAVRAAIGVGAMFTAVYFGLRWRRLARIRPVRLRVLPGGRETG